MFQPHTLTSTSSKQQLHPLNMPGSFSRVWSNFSIRKKPHESLPNETAIAVNVNVQVEVVPVEGLKPVWRDELPELALSNPNVRLLGVDVHDLC